jgi:RimJ/RimL family protein N-acetyltransferase
MQTLNDKNNAIEWLLIDYEKDYTAQENRDKIKPLRQQLNSWSSDNIRRYITKMPVGDFAYDMCDIYNDRYDDTKCFHVLAFEDGILVGTAIIANNSNDIKIEFNNYTLPNNLKILYLVINPDYQNRGIGTRMIKSIIDNQQFFSQSAKTSGISGEIHKDNIASQKAILKNHFEVYRPFTKNDDFSTYFYIEDKSNTPNL